MGTFGTIVTTAQEAPLAISRTQAHRQPESAFGDSVCSQNRPALGAPSSRTGLGLRHDSLAPPLRLAAPGHLGQNPPSTVDSPARSRPDRLVPCHRGFLLGTRHPWGEKTGPNPTDRGKSGSKHHLLTDANGIPLANQLTAANAHDVTQLLPLVDAIPPVHGHRGRPRQRPELVQGDRAYHSHPHRKELRRRGIEPLLARRHTEHGSGLGVYRWVVERSFSWPHQFRRLRVRCERRDDIHQAFLTLGCIIICGYFL